MISTQPMRNFDCYTVQIHTSTLEEMRRTIAQYSDCAIKHPTTILNGMYNGIYETVIENKNLDVYGAPKSA